MEKRNVTVSAIVAAIVLIGDQLSKHWAETWLRTNGEYKIWDGVLHLRYVENRGAAFSMMQGGKWFFLAITGIACAAMLYFLIKERKRLHFMMTFSLALLLSGCAGDAAQDQGGDAHAAREGLHPRRAPNTRGWV